MKIDISSDNQWVRLTIDGRVTIMPMEEWTWVISHPGQFSPPQPEPPKPLPFGGGMFTRRPASAA